MTLLEFIDKNFGYLVGLTVLALFFVSMTLATILGKK
jgi:hypothetical protein